MDVPKNNDAVVLERCLCDNPDADCNKGSHNVKLRDFEFRSAESVLHIRQPVVHLFVCDFKNVKVKEFTDICIKVMSENGIKIYTDFHMKHHPGYQVKAASFNTQADFFFQIQSKTARLGLVRLYVHGKPQKMNLKTSISYIWNSWKMYCGALSEQDVETLSSKKLSYIFKRFIGLEIDYTDIQEVQEKLRLALNNKLLENNIEESLIKYRKDLMSGRDTLLNLPDVSCLSCLETGGVIQKCTISPVILGASEPLKNVLKNIIEMTLCKVDSLLEIYNNNFLEIDKTSLKNDSMNVDLSIDSEPQMNWSLIVESYEDKVFEDSSKKLLYHRCIELLPSFLFE